MAFSGLESTGASMILPSITSVPLHHSTLLKGQWKESQMRSLENWMWSPLWPEHLIGQADLGGLMVSVSFLLAGPD